MLKLMTAHRAVRKFKATPIDSELLETLLRAATRTASAADMQLYSFVVVRDENRRRELLACHDRPTEEAPCLVTVCADINRFMKWSALRGADIALDNIGGFLTAAGDAFAAAQSLALAAESQGAGVRVLGTALPWVAEIARILKLPHGVFPLTTLALGYPDEALPSVEPLPLDAVVHCDTYRDYTDSEIEELWAEREAASGTDAGAPVSRYARLFPREECLATARACLALLRRQGFDNH